MLLSNGERVNKLTGIFQFFLCFALYCIVLLVGDCQNCLVQNWLKVGVMIEDEWMQFGDESLNQLGKDCRCYLNYSDCLDCRFLTFCCCHQQEVLEKDLILKQHLSNKQSIKQLINQSRNQQEVNTTRGIWWLTSNNISSKFDTSCCNRKQILCTW